MGTEISKVGPDLLQFSLENAYYDLHSDFLLKKVELEYDLRCCQFMFKSREKNSMKIVFSFGGVENIGIIMKESCSDHIGIINLFKYHQGQINSLSLISQSGIEIHFSFKSGFIELS